MLAAACTPFTADPPAAGDAGTSADAGIEAGPSNDGGPHDAGSTDGGCVPGPLFSDALDELKVPPWTLSGSDLTFTGAGDAKSNGKLLRLTTVTASSATYYGRPMMVGQCSFQLDLSVQFRQAGAGEIDFVSVLDQGPGAKGFAFVHRASDGKYVLEPPALSPLELPTPTAGWHALSIRFDRRTGKVTLAIDGTDFGGVAIPTNWGAGGVELRLGAPYYASASGWTVDFDDVALSVLP